MESVSVSMPAHPAHSSEPRSVNVRLCNHVLKSIWKLKKSKNAPHKLNNKSVSQ